MLWCLDFQASELARLRPPPLADFCFLHQFYERILQTPISGQCGVWGAEDETGVSFKLWSLITWDWSSELLQENAWAGCFAFSLNGLVEGFRKKEWGSEERVQDHFWFKKKRKKRKEKKQSLCSNAKPWLTFLLGFLVIEKTWILKPSFPLPPFFSLSSFSNESFRNNVLFSKDHWIITHV